MAQHNDLGSKGEILAENYLRNKGYSILEKNWLYKRNEIDLIASNDEFIVFVEVKTRSSGYWGNPEDSISISKIKKIVHAANLYINLYDIEKPVRFDVIAIVMNNKFTDINHFEDAFLAPLN